MIMEIDDNTINQQQNGDGTFNGTNSSMTSRGPADSEQNRLEV